MADPTSTTAAKPSVPSSDPGSDWQSKLSQLADLKSREATLSPTDYKSYVDLLTEVNKGPSDFTDIQAHAVNKFQADLTSALSKGAHGLTAKEVTDIASKAAKNFVVDRKTGEQSLADFVIQNGAIDSPELRSTLSNISSSMPSYIPQGKGDFSNELSRVNTLYGQSQKSASQNQTQNTIAAQGQGYQQQAQGLMEASRQAMASPEPIFSPELSQEVMQNLQSIIQKQGSADLANTQAAAQARGLTGSSIEQFGMSQTQGNTQQNLVNATLNFLLQSGQAGAQNRDFIVQTLSNQANTLLAAGQGAQGLAVNTNLSQQGLDLQQTQLQNQILQFNKQLEQQSTQFNQSLDFQKSQAAQDMHLLLQQLNQHGGPSPFSSAMSGITGGAGIGFGLSMIPGVGIPLAAGLGAAGGLGLGLGSFYGSNK